MNHLHDLHESTCSSSSSSSSSSSQHHSSANHHHISIQHVNMTNRHCHHHHSSANHHYHHQPCSCSLFIGNCDMIQLAAWVEHMSNVDAFFKVHVAIQIFPQKKSVVCRMETGYWLLVYWHTDVRMLEYLSIPFSSHLPEHQPRPLAPSICNSQASTHTQVGCVHLTGIVDEKSCLKPMAKNGGSHHFPILHLVWAPVRSVKKNA